MPALARPSLNGIVGPSRVLSEPANGPATIIASEEGMKNRPVAELGGLRAHEGAERTAVPGVATGLAYTPVGGEVLFVEATSMRGKEGFVLTGQLGDVMKESDVEESVFEEREFHLHVPAGAVPKDGPSAGVTMTTALASLLTGRPVKHTVGMTGEVTLQGRVLPIGGVKQKVLAAYAAGLTEVVLPERNRADLDEVPGEVREAMTFHPVMTMGEAFELALEPAHALEMST